jgi:hypothetical protein
VMVPRARWSAGAKIGSAADARRSDDRPFGANSTRCTRIVP